MSTLWTEAEIATVRRLAAEGKPARAISEEIGRTIKAVRNIISIYWIEMAAGSGKAPELAPADFAEKWATMGVRQLAVHYGRGEKMITRWVKQLGLVRPRENRCFFAKVAICSDYIEGLVRRIEIYSAKYGVAPTRITRLTVKDSDLFYRMREGRAAPRPHVTDRIEAYMANPSNDPRPHKPDLAAKEQRRVTPHMDLATFDTIMGSERLFERVQRYYGRVAERRKCSIEAAQIICNYSPAQIQRMAA